MKPHILYLITNADLAGAQVHLLELLGEIKSSYRITVVTGDKGHLTDACSSMGVEVHVIESLQRAINPWRDIVAYFAVVRLFDRLNPDLIHTHSSKAGTLGRLAANKLNLPAIHTTHGWAFGQGAPLLRKLLSIPVEMLLARLTQRIIAVCEADRDIGLHYKISGPDRFVLIHNGISDIPLKFRVGVNDPVHIVMVARFSPQKDHASLINAINQLDSPVRLSLIGSGPCYHQVKRQVETANLSHCIELPGERVRVEEVLAQADVFVLTSFWEGLPISVLEAMRGALPIIATDVGGVSEMVDHGENGFLVRPGNVSSIVKYLARLAQNKHLRHQLGQNSRLRFEQNFTARRMAAKTQTVYQQVLESVSINSRNC